MTTCLMTGEVKNKDENGEVKNKDGEEGNGAKIYS